MTPTDSNFISNEATAASNECSLGHFAAAFSHLRAAAKIDPAIARDAEALEARFFYMLRFLASNNDVDNIDSTLADLSRAFMILVERTRLAISAQSDTTVLSGALRYSARRPEESIETLVSDYLAELDRLRTDAAALTDTRRKSSLERISSDIFTRVWIEFPLRSDSSDLLLNMITDSSLPPHDRCLWVNALGLNMHRYATSVVADTLLDIHAGSEEELSTTAAVWLMLALREAMRNNSLTTSDRSCVLRRMEQAHPGDIGDIVLEWSRSLGTENISEEMRKLLHNNFGKMGRRFTDRLKDLDPEKYDEALMNSEWLTEGIGTSGYDSIKKFAEAQQRGDDVFMATIGKMRGFEFFNTMPNWFLPFHTGHSALAPVVDGEGAAVADMIARMPMMCDSDKYALILSIAQAPDQLRSQSMAAMSQQMMGLSSSEEFEDMIRSMSQMPRRALINNCIKNIYRFFHGFRAAKEFSDTLSREPVREFTEHIFNHTPDTLAEIADIMFASKRYPAAFGIYAHFDTPGGCDLADSRLQKYAFSAEMADRKDKAVEIYRNVVEKGSSGTTWAAIRLAAILIAEDEAAKAIELLEPYAYTESADTDLLATLAAAYVNADRWDEAVGVYHNIDYVLPDGDKSASADLAWALTVCGDYDAAQEIFADLPDTVSTLHRHSVLLWLTGRRPEAIEMQEKAARLAKQARTADPDPLFHKGVAHLLVTNKDAASLSLIDEILRYRLYGSSFGNII